MPIMRSLGRRRRSVSGQAVRSRMVSRMSKSASAAAATSSVSKAPAKNVRLAREASEDQSALLRATSCQSSRIAILIIIISFMGASGRDRRTASFPASIPMPVSPPRLQGSSTATSTARSTSFCPGPTPKPPAQARGHVDYLASLFYRGGGHMPRLFRTEPLPATTAKDARSTRSEKGLEGPPRRLRSLKLTMVRRTPKACSAFSL